MKKLLLLVLIFSSILSTGQTLVPFFKKNGKYTFVEYATMKPTINQEFDSRPDIFFNDYLVVNKAGKSILIDKKGKVYLTNFDGIEGYNNGVAIVVSNNKRGLASINGNLFFKPKYDKILCLSENLYWASIGDQMELIDTKGNKAFPVKYDKIGNWGWESVEFSRNGKWGLIDYNGKEVLGPIFEESELGGFSNGFSKVESDGWYGYKNRLNKLVIPFMYEKGEDFHQDRAFIQFTTEKNERIRGYIDTTGKLVCSFKGAIECKNYSEGYATVKTELCTFVIDTKGTVKLIFAREELPKGDRNYDQAYVDEFNSLRSSNTQCVIVKPITNYNGSTPEEFHEGLAAIGLYKKGADEEAVAYINKEGKVVFLIEKCRTEGTLGRIGFGGTFYKGFALLDQTTYTNGNNSFFIDKEGRDYREK